MNKTLILLGVAVAGFAGTADAQVSVNVGVPGLYGRVDIGGYPAPPPVLYRQPVYAQRPPGRDAPPPVYLHVPPGHERHWRQHCNEYNACGQPVYFVQHDWYRNTYARRGDDHRGDDRRGDDHRGDDHRGEDHRGDDHRGGPGDRIDDGRGRR